MTSTRRSRRDRIDFEFSACYARPLVLLSHLHVEVTDQVLVVDSEKVFLMFIYYCLIVFSQIGVNMETE